MSRTVLVTVGSTKFDELIRAVDSQPFADELVAQGYNKLIMQASHALPGISPYLPPFLTSASFLSNFLSQLLPSGSTLLREQVW